MKTSGLTLSLQYALLPTAVRRLYLTLEEFNSLQH